MANCVCCMKEMTKVDGCVEIPIPVNDKNLTPIRFGKEERYGPDWQKGRERCHDCGAKMGQFHHPGCDWEECPNCGHQLLGCDCVAEKQ